MDDTYYMRQALVLAQSAAKNGEVAVGAVVVKNGEIIATGCNASISQLDPTAHAEIVALRAAAKHLGNYRLDDCELFVTLEPCAMCSGAMLHARLKRVVFGAFDARTGAAGSVLNLFNESAINHQTQVLGGVLAQECGELIRAFFKHRRHQQHLKNSAGQRLREDALRTPEICFEAFELQLPQFHPTSAAPEEGIAKNKNAVFSPSCYVHDLVSLDGLRMHYLDTHASLGAQGNLLNNAAPIEKPPATQSLQQRTWLCLHDFGSWSYAYHPWVMAMHAQGDRVIAPDLIGFGRSDKPKKKSAHTFFWHRQMVLEWIEKLDLHNIVLVGEGWGGMLGLTLPMEQPQRYQGFLAINAHFLPAINTISADYLTWLKQPKLAFDGGRTPLNEIEKIEQQAAYKAPFPDRGHQAVMQAGNQLLLLNPIDSSMACVQAKSQQFWQHQWHGKSLALTDPQDLLMGTARALTLAPEIRGEIAHSQFPNHSSVANRTAWMIAQARAWFE